MMNMSQAAEATGGRLVGDDVIFNWVSSDSRKLGLGNLFIALRGDRFDGYEFVEQAVSSGATAVMVNADSYETNPITVDTPVSVLVVDDTRISLGTLAGWWRKQFNIPVVAITGSNGKTTVKEMLAGILREAAGGSNSVLATHGNLNNDIGMPLTLLQLNAMHRFAVIEMGMNHPGEIDYLTRIASPDVALINNAGGAHLEGLGTVQAVAEAKGEIFAGLEHHGTAVINADDEHASLWRGLAGAHPLLEFGLSPKADISGTWQASENDPQNFGMQLDVQTPQGNFSAALKVPGEHNARNALAATAAATALNIPLEKIVAGLEKFKGVPGRLQRRDAINGATLLDDTYNANPSSVHAAIDVLARSAGKRILVLGDMGELGEAAAAFHSEIGAAAKTAGLDKLFALGELSINATQKFGKGALHFVDMEDLCKALENELDANTTLLVKGSRFMQMERIVERLKSI